MVEMRNVLICENIRSAYNVGVMIRTAECLGRDVCLSGYSPHPDTNDKVLKSSLGAETMIGLTQYWNTTEALEFYKDQGYLLVALEITKESNSLRDLNLDINTTPIALVVGNETTGVLPETLATVDHVCHIPMVGKKASLNVAEAATIGIWEMGD